MPPPGPELQVDLLQRLIRSVAEALDLGAPLDEGLGVLAQALGAERSAIFLLDDGLTKLCRQRGLDEGVLAAIGRAVPWSCCETTDPTVVRSLRGGDATFDEEVVRALLAAGVESILRLPLTCRGRVLGEIVVLGESPDGWDDGAVAFGMHVATLLCGAVERETAVRITRRSLELADHVPVGLLVEREDGVVTFCNAEFCRLFGLNSPAAVIGRRVADVIQDVTVLVDRKGFCDRATTLADAGIPSRGVWVPVVDNRTYEQSFVPVAADGGPVRRLWTYSDVTDRRRFEERLVHIEKMESLAALAGGVAHDFNNLLTSIVGHLDLLRGETSDGTSARAYVDHMQLASQQASELAKQLLAFSSPSSPTLSEVDLADLVSDSLAILRRLMPPEIAVEFHRRTDESVVLGDPTRLHQVLSNLCINARDAMPNGGLLTLELESAQIGDRPAVLLRVRDNGTGMDEDTRRRVFEPLFTTKEPGKGTGLGLATCYGVIDGMDGELTVHTEPGKGSEFRVLLPLQVEPADRVEWTAPPGESGAQVLVVDDEVHVRSVLRNCLVANGFQVSACASGEEALAALGETRYDIVVSDVTMGGMSGFELVRQVRDRHPGLPILLMTGFADEVLDEPAQAPLLEKPFLPRELVDKIRAELVAARDHG